MQLLIIVFLFVLGSDTWFISQGQSKVCKYFGTTHRRVGVGWHTQSILKSNKHWSKTPTKYITFGHLHPEALASDRWNERMKKLDKYQGPNKVRWRPGQEASLARPCSNLRGFGSNLLYSKMYMWHCWDFSAPPAFVWELSPLVTHLMKLTLLDNGIHVVSNQGIKCREKMGNLMFLCVFSHFHDKVLQAIALAHATVTSCQQSCLECSVVIDATINYCTSIAGLKINIFSWKSER